jgi:hypothetical protein
MTSAATQRFSIIVPVFAQWHLIPGLLSCPEKQTLPRSLFEVVLVDNGSVCFTPPTNLPSNIKILRCEKPGSYAARNEGAAHANGEWLVFTDADCLPRSAWLETLEGLIRQLSLQKTLLAGSIEMIAQSKHPNQYEIYDIVRGIPQDRYVKRGYGATANLAILRSTFMALGGFDDLRFSGGDAEFCRRAIANGCRLQYVQAATVCHPARSNWEEIATKARRVKGGQLRHGTLARRLLWAVATVAPPIRNIWLLLRTPKQSARYRLIAAGVQLRVWPVELKELTKLLFGVRPERR